MISFRTVRVFAAHALCASALLLSGCGYTFQGGGSVLPPDVRKVYIPRVENNSTESNLGTLFTEALQDQFERYGVISVVDSLTEADAVLRARILRLRRETGTVTASTDTELQVDTTITLAAELRKVTGEVLWRDPNMSITKSFGTSSSVVVTTSPDFAGNTLSSSDLSTLESGGTREVARGQEEEAFTVMAEETARQIYDAAVAPDF